jgi:uncharacterized protein YaaW (UPF0174 family)
VRDLALDPATGDLALTTVGSVRAASMVTGADALRQKLRLRLSLGAGEYVLDRTVGMPLFSQIFNRASGRAVAESAYRRAVSTCPGVRSLDTLRLTVDSQRRATLAFAVTAETGDVLTVADFVAAS